eukprot:g8876.t1
MESRTLHSPSKPEAWVTLVLGLDLSYVSAALVLASALRRKHTRGELVCMVTPDVPEGPRQHLTQFYDLVVEVPYLQTLALQKYSGRFDSMYNYWLDKSFTKFALFGLVEYEKIVFLDADMFPLENPDALFECPTPAGICSSVKGPAENDKLHGMPLARLVIDESLKNGQGHYGVRGCLLIFKPDMNVYKALKQKVEEAGNYGSLESMVGPDEYLITKYFIDNWHHVHAKYGWVSWADRQDLGVDPCFLHYVSQKPWAEGESWEDFKYWKEEAKEVVKFNPELLVYFSHIAKTIAEMAELQLPDEISLQITLMQKSSLQRKTEEKNRRLEAARLAKIDLTDTNVGSVRKSNDFSFAPSSARATVFPPRSSPTTTVSVNRPNSARVTKETSPVSSASNINDTLLVKVNPNILVVNGYKRPAGAKPKEKAKPKQQHNGGNKGRKNKTNVVVNKEDTKPAVPKLNLRNVNSNDEMQNRGATWTGHHWKKHNGETSGTLSSRADVQTDWRTPGRGNHPIHGSAGGEPTQSQSARNWPQTPTTDGNKSGRKKETVVAKKDHTPRSSRADLASNWRSTPRQSPADGGDWRTPRGLSQQNQHSRNRSSPYPENGNSYSPSTSGVDLS